MSHGWHRCQHDGGCSDTPAKIRDQLRQVAGPASGRLELEHVIDSQCEHDDVHRGGGNLGDQSGSSGMRGRSDLSRGVPMHASAGARGERGGNLTGEGVRVIGCANPRDRRLADDQKSQGNALAGDRPDGRPRGCWKPRRTPSHVAALHPQDRQQGDCHQRRRADDHLTHRTQAACPDSPVCSRSPGGNPASNRTATPTMIATSATLKIPVRNGPMPTFMKSTTLPRTTRSTQFDAPPAKTSHTPISRHPCQ